MPRPEAGPNSASGLRRGIKRFSRSTSDVPKNFPWSRRTLLATGDGCLSGCHWKSDKQYCQSCESRLKPKKIAAPFRGLPHTNSSTGGGLIFPLQFDKNSRFLCSKSVRKDNSERRRTFLQRQRETMGLGPCLLGRFFIGISVSLSIELLQIYLATRDSSMTDLICNAIGRFRGSCWPRLECREARRCGYRGRVKLCNYYQRNVLQY